MSSSLTKLKQKQTSTINRLPSTQPEPRRSSRSRQPSLHKLESGKILIRRSLLCTHLTEDEYKAESQRTSRAATPSTSKSKPKSKNPNREKGNRPGRIVQPVDAWTAQHSESPEPLAQPGSPSVDFDMEGKDSQVETISISKAIARVLARLGYDVLWMPDDVIQDVLEDIEVLEAEADCSRPMEIEDGAPQALWQSSNRVAMGRGPQGLAGEAPDDVDQSEELPQQLAYPNTLLPLSRAVSKTARDDDTATECSDEAELGPGDSVSQRVPQETENLPEPSHRAPPQPDLVPNHVHNAKRTSDDTADEPDDPPIPTKRQRSPHSHQTATSRTIATAPNSNTLPLILWASRPMTQPQGCIIFSTAPKSSSAASSSLSSAPPISDVDAVLTPKPQANKTQYLRSRKDTDFVEDDAEILEAEVALALGKRINVPRKPCLSHFPGFHRHIASNAIPDLVATLITEGVYDVTTLV
ncbi:hypothetical protein RhiJN_27188 [Ceratobasidium sp. AG-Ba]|nr:hypothetical protein RhiJN_27188 [Ceratobasidium sp. AG-Ba]